MNKQNKINNLILNVKIKTSKIKSSCKQKNNKISSLISAPKDEFKINENSVSPIKIDMLWEKICMRLTQCTAQKLYTKQQELQEIKWNDGEANIDSGLSTLACNSCKEAFNDIKEEYPEYNNLSIKCEIPDINILFYKDSKIIASGKIELKSGKGKGLIPGSTLGTLNINEPIIFCLKNESTFDFRYSQYYNCIGESNTDMFQDRTPRPYVNFKKMTDINTSIEYVHKEKNDWVEHYAECALFRIKAKKPYKSWQDNLIEKIKNLSIKEFIKETSVEEFAKFHQLLKQIES